MWIVTRHFKISLYFDFLQFFADWQWNEKCKKLNQLNRDTTRSIKKDEKKVDSKEIWKCYKIELKHFLYTSKKKNASKLKIWLKTLLLSYVKYANAEVYYKPRQTSKTEISANIAKALRSLTIFAKNSIPVVSPVS